MKEAPQHLRKAFILKMAELAERDPKVILIVGDVGFSYMDEYIQKFPNQWLNAGIAEQNMMGMAAGLAAVGWKPYIYTMTNFILLRPLEQLRNDICFANANVKLFGVKGGESYKFLGMSHNMTETETEGILAGLREMNLKDYRPKTEAETETIMELEYRRSGPAYLQI